MSTSYVDDCDGCGLHGLLECPMYYDSEEKEMSGISKETFMEMSTDSKLGVLFDYMVEVQDTQPKRVKARDLKCEKRQVVCDARFVKVERSLARQKLFNTAAAFIGGFVGGWSAVWTAFKLSIF